MIYQQHPLSAAFPSMSQDEIESLAVDIQANGQREPGIIFEDMVLDGWHRYLACEILGIEFDCKPLAKFDDPVLFVISRNLHRRHLTGSQRAAAVVACNEWAPAHRPNKVVPGTSLPKATNAEMAKIAGVSESTIQHAKTAEKAGTGVDVRDGNVSAKKAAEKAKGKPEKKQSIQPKALYSNPKTDPEREITDEEVAAFGDADFVQLYEDSQNEIDALQKRIDQYELDDKNAEIARLNTYIDRINGLNDQLQNGKNTADEMAQRYADLLKKIRKALGVENNKDILLALKKAA